METNNIEQARKSEIEIGYVKDHKKYDLTGTEGVNSQGIHFVVLERDETREKSVYYKVKFDTGHTGSYDAGAIRRSEIKDYSVPTVFGFGIIGRFGITKEYPMEYNKWYEMIRRCCNKDSPEYDNYGAIGITIDERWRYFENFIEDIKSLPGYDDWKNNPSKYELDKDLIQDRLGVPHNQKVYSKDTCCFITKEYNRSLSGCNVKATDLPIGVIKKRDAYRVVVQYKPSNLFIIQSFDCPEAAASMRDHIIDIYKLSLAKNYDNPPMGFYESMQHRRYPITIKRKGDLCKVIKKPLCKIVDKKD